MGSTIGVAVYMHQGLSCIYTHRSEGVPHVNVTTQIRRTHAAAQTVTTALAYRARSGRIAALVETGALVRVSNYLTALGLDAEFVTRYGSPFGRHVAKAHRAAGRGEPVRVWICNKRGHYVHVFVYEPGDAALHAAVGSYPRTRHLLTAIYTEAA